MHGKAITAVGVHIDFFMCFYGRWARHASAMHRLLSSMALSTFWKDSSARYAIADFLYVWHGSATSRVGHITPKFGRMLRALLEFQKNILEMISRCSVCAKCNNAENDDKQVVVSKFQRRFLHFLSPCMRELSCVSASAATLTMLAPSLKDTGQTRAEEHPRKCVADLQSFGDLCSRNDGWLVLWST